MSFASITSLTSTWQTLSPLEKIAYGSAVTVAINLIARRFLSTPKNTLARWIFYSIIIIPPSFVIISASGPVYTSLVAAAAVLALSFLLRRRHDRNIHRPTPASNLHSLVLRTAGKSFENRLFKAYHEAQNNKDNHLLYFIELRFAQYLQVLWSPGQDAKPFIEKLTQAGVKKLQFEGDKVFLEQLEPLQLESLVLVNSSLGDINTICKWPLVFLGIRSCPKETVSKFLQTLNQPQAAEVTKTLKGLSIQNCDLTTVDLEPLSKSNLQLTSLDIMEKEGNLQSKYLSYIQNFPLKQFTASPMDFKQEDLNRLSASLTSLDLALASISQTFDLSRFKHLEKLALTLKSSQFLSSSISELPLNMLIINKEGDDPQPNFDFANIIAKMPLRVLFCGFYLRDLSVLKGKPLKVLHLEGYQLHTGEVLTLCQFPLKSLKVSWDAPFMALSKLPNTLEGLFISRPSSSTFDCSDSHLIKFLQTHPDLRKLHISGETTLTDQSLEAIAALPLIQELSFDDCVRFTTWGLGHLQRLPLLKTCKLVGLTCEIPESLKTRVKTTVT